MSAQQSVQRPGMGLDIDHYQKHPRDLEEGGPHAVFNHGWSNPCVLLREKRLVEAIDQLSASGENDKPDWRRKVFDEEITSKWRREVVSNAEPGFSDAMFDFCLAELQDKAKQNEDTGIATTYETGPVVAKSDSIVPEDDRKLLVDAVARLLEDVPDRHKDWHPGYNDQVLDLVHPSLFPLVYGRTRVLTNETIGVEDALQHIGHGVVASLPPNDSTDSDEVFYNRRFGSLWSYQFQWLPSEVSFTDNGVKLDSYINNLHPQHHRALYPIIEKMLGFAIPLWDAVFARVKQDETVLRFEDRKAEYEYFEGTGFDEWSARRRAERRARATDTADNVNEEDDPEAGISTDSPVELDSEEEQDEEDEFNDFVFDSDHETEWPRRRRRLIPPEPMPYDLFKARLPERHHPLLKEAYGQEGLQVIVKLANIHLTPEKPNYTGGSWHIEGMLNEMICATALYYYDCKNVTDSYLAFRQTVDCEEMEMNAHGQDDYSGLETLFGIEQNGRGVQDVGRTLTRQGRLLAFPNMVQHQVCPFSLADKTRPGHRKILAFFLVNPKARVLSTANVPPQRKDWWEEELRKTGGLDRVPEELRRRIVEEVDDFPYGVEEAKRIRERLMEERKSYNVYADEQVICEREFFFCEH
ncbi:hypothetical protein BDZ85DRAFT_272677 [Elsinoe ampelina]|uniref:Uncharacterized protein n=1 Tax=Elsinoe ampelina TaxID=302913 RepID=A0A6A6GKN0_9PEZI|nr:hypothetical protein BDZ85DRAFT_272677 [Elsinoe ampelina]